MANLYVIPVVFSKMAANYDEWYSMNIYRYKNMTMSSSIKKSITNMCKDYEEKMIL